MDVANRPEGRGAGVVRGRRFVIVAVFLLSLASCSPTPRQAGKGPVNVDPIATTVNLDPDAEQIDFPLDKFMLTIPEMEKIEQANSAKMQQCLAFQGQKIDLSPYNRHRTFAGERPYGAWSLKSAQERGYDMPEGFTDGKDLDLSTQGEKFNEAWDVCLATSLVSKGAHSDRTAERLFQQAAMLAPQSEEFTKVVGAWKDCLKGKGISLKDGDSWNPDLSTTNGDQEKIIRIAVGDVECKQTVSLVQRLANIEASYQTALIKQNESQLRAERQAIDTMLARADEAILSAGA
ncbi:hypothetical protein SPF06_02165 [Sinomonas sp. JGH33]|uniref:Lipoprotein n=1 Tax=Sinomonas terricola TaxID=3110330 RepID=A0ABU5T1K1_9MICC|nr:hypothetical protein [Sinomonas sp. JGH33]MEA5453518.1 hypothetical protein [Sinomonas sp. JGH33]